MRKLKGLWAAQAVVACVLSSTQAFSFTVNTARVRMAAVTATSLDYADAVCFFDCDDCLYFNDWSTAALITEAIERYCVDKCGCAPGEAYQLYKKHGTALK